MAADLVTIFSKLEVLIADITEYEKALWDANKIRDAKLCHLNLERLQTTYHSVWALLYKDIPHETDKIESRRISKSK